MRGSRDRQVLHRPETTPGHLPSAGEDMRIKLTRRLPLLCAAAGLWLALPAPAGIVVLQNAPVYLVEFGPAERVEPFGSLPQFASTYLHLRLAAIQGGRGGLIREQPVCGANTLPPPPQNEEQASARRSVPAPQVTSYVVSGTLRRKPGDHEDALELSYELIKRTDCRPETLLKQSSTFDPDELLTRLSVVSDEIANSLADSISNKAIVLVSEIDGGAKDAGTLQQLLLDTLSDSKAFRGQQSVAPPRVAGYIVEGKLSAISGRNLKARYTLELTAVAGKERYPLTSGSGGPFADERQLYRYYIGEVRKAVSRLETVHYQRQVGLSSEYSKTPDAEILQKSREALCEPRKTGCEPKPEIALALLEERLDRLQPADEAYTLASRAYRLAGQDVAAAELHERRLAQVRAPGQRQQILIAAGDAWMQAHEYGRAAERYQQALALSRESGDSVPEVIGKRARALRLDDKPAEALKFLLDNRKDSASWEDEIAEELAGLRSISQLQPICTTLRQRLGTASLATGQCLARLGRLQSADENYVEAAANLRQAAGILGGREDADEGWATLASTEREASHYEAAAAAAGRALDLRVAAYGASSSQAADTETLLGTIYAQWQKLPEAKSHLENAIAIYDKLPDVNEIDLVRALDWLGHAEQEATPVDAAERADRRALAILRKQSAAYSSWQADSLQKLGDLAKLRADFRVAEDYYRQSLQLREKDGPGSAEHLYSQYLLADALMELGRFVEARNLYTSVLEGRKKLGVEPDYIAQSYGALGLMYSQWGMYPESETNWRLSLDFRLKVPKPSARAVEMVRYSLGATLGQLGRYAEGERLLRQGFEAQVAEYGRCEFGHAASEKNLVFAHFHGDGGDAARAPFVVVEEVVGLGDVAVSEEILVFGGRLPGAVRRLVMAHGEERLLRVALFEPVEREIADQVGAVAGILLAPGAGEERGIVINALAGENVPVVEAGGLARQVPLADHRRLVTCALEFLGDVIALGVERVVQRVDAVLVAVLPGKNRGAAGRADGIGAEAVGEANARARDAVDIGRLVDAAAIGGDGVGGVIVRHDVENVGLGTAFCQGGGAEQAKQFAASISRHCKGTLS